MRRSPRLILPALLAIALVPASAAAGSGAGPVATIAAGAGGHNPATNKLERSFTAALSARINSKNGCYPSEKSLAKQITKRWKFRVLITKGIGGVRRTGMVYVLSGATTCNNVRFALRQGALYELDSVRGEIVVLGKAAARARARAAERANRGPLRGISIANKTFNVSTKHRRLRYESNCPGGKLPLGGGLTQAAVGAGGEAIYPHSYERLGAQRGWHITGWLFDGGDGAHASRQLTIQAVCGRGLAPYSAPHKTTFVKPGQQRTVTARCPGGQQLMSGGYQRTDFLDDGGDYVTESRAVGSRAWRVSGAAHGTYGGELTAIAYCTRSKKPLLTEVAATSTVPFGAAATATTPPCPGGRVLTSGGFSTDGGGKAWFAGGSINADDTWSAHSYGTFGPAPTLTAYGYCLQPGT